MSSLKRPGKKAPAPAPFYLNERNDVRYCYTCGRVISSKRAPQNQLTSVKYCSDSCRRRKPGKEDEQIEQLIVSLLDGNENLRLGDDISIDKSAKRDRRRLLMCVDIEKAFHQRFSSAEPTVPAFQKEQDYSDAPEPSPVTETDTAHMSASPNTTSREAPLSFEGVVNPEVQTLQPYGQDKQLEGQKRAEQRERVRRAARRAVVFGLPKPILSSSRPENLHKASLPQLDGKTSQNQDQAPGSVRYKCEAVQHGRVIEPSFAKGDWGIRWRE